MAIKPQVLAAIGAAIQDFLLDEELAMQAAAISMAPAALGPPPNFWGLAGRQAAMQFRMLMQRRSFK